LKDNTRFDQFIEYYISQNYSPA